MLEQIHHCRGAWGGGGAGKGGGVGGGGTRAYLSASANPPSLQRGMERVRGGWWWWGGVDKSLLKLFQCFCKSIFAVGHGESGWEGWWGGGGATRAYSSASAKSIIAMGHGGWG